MINLIRQYKYTLLLAVVIIGAVVLIVRDNAHRDEMRRDCAAIGGVLVRSLDGEYVCVDAPGDR